MRTEFDDNDDDYSRGGGGSSFGFGSMFRYLMIGQSEEDSTVYRTRV